MEEDNMPNFKVLENNGTFTTASEGITINKLNQHNKNVQEWKKIKNNCLLILDNKV